MDIDLADIYSHISYRKKRSKLHTDNCTAEQIFYQIRELTDSIIEHADSLLSKMRHCDTKDDLQMPSQDSSGLQETEDGDSALEDDILDCPKKFFAKMDEDIGTKDSSDDVTSDYLADLDADLEEPDFAEHM